MTVTLTESTAAVRSTPVYVVHKLDDMAAKVADVSQPGDLVITLGAGSISGLATMLVAELHRRMEDRA